MITGDQTDVVEPAGSELTDFLAFGRSNRAATADQDAGKCALEATEQASEEASNACAVPARPGSPRMPSPSIASVTVPRSGYARPFMVI